jgi:hypothetical protein
MAIVKKISELTPKGSNLGTTDLLIVGVDNGTDYDLKSVTGAQLLGTVVSQTITDGVTAKAPSENVVYDNLALKVDKVDGSRLITSAEATILGNTSGVNSGNETNGTISTIVNSATLSTAPDDTDKLPISNTLGTIKGLTWSLLKSTLNSFFLSSADSYYTKKSNNLSDLTNTTTARTNLGLGSLATQSGTFSGTSSGTNTGDQDLSTLVVKNTAITGATKTKITYDSKGLVTSGTDATTADISDSLNKRYVTDANLTVIGNTSGTNTGDQTFLDARVQSVASSATVTPTSANDLVKITAQAVGLTLANPTGTFTEGQALMIRIKDNGTARTIAFDTNYRAIGVTLPTTTVISKTLYLGIIYNSTDAKWDVIGYNLQA